MKHLSVKKAWLLGFLMCVFMKMSATHESTNTRLNSPSFIKGSSLYVMDNKYFQITGSTVNFRDASAKTRVLIGLDKASTAVISAYRYKFVINVTYHTYAGSVLTPVSATHTLEVAYDPAQNGADYEDLAVLELNGGYLVTAKIQDIINVSTGLSVITPPSNLYFETEVDAERYYNMNFTSIPFYATSIAPSNVTASGEIEVTWPFITGAEEYDLEWVWVSDDIMSTWEGISIPFNYEIDFKNNSTRIRTKNQYYRISNVFEKGKVFFRVRGVGYTDQAGNGIFDQQYYTPWTASDYYSLYLLPSSISCPTSPVFYICVNNDHEQDKNWQYKATYAEDGKKKEVISYFDGTLRNRQSVTKSNTDGNAIVAETYYDYQGRAAVQALPVPTGFSNIKFYQYDVTLSGAHNWGFNFADGSKESFNRKHFDEDGTGANCSATGQGMEDDFGITTHNIGSAAYYSPFNNLPASSVINKDYIPNAENYPYTQTEYMPDNTGRISRQGGVGQMHQLDSHHETRYFYGSPSLQEELDRLFGSDVGDYKHYKKNMVIDANGQVSISYLDQEGRTVATALAGITPDNVSTLASNSGTISISGNLLNKDAATDVNDDQDNNIIGDGGKSLTFSKDILVTSQAEYKFTYDMTGTAFTYECSESTICYDCVYDLEINILDKCGQNPAGFTPIKQKVGNITPSQFSEDGKLTVDYDCDEAVQFNLTPNPLVVTLEPGAYTIYKTLSINEKALADYLTHYINNNPCIKTEEDFIGEATGHIDTSGCEIDCADCVLALGSKDDFIANGGTEELFNQAVKACMEPCEYKTTCEAAEVAMLADISPGGQYADWENGNLCDPSQFSLSVLNENNALPMWGSASPNWRHPRNISGIAEDYKEEDGTVSYITISKIWDADDAVYVYIPDVASTASSDLIPDPNNPNLFTTKPTNLKDVCVFKSQWKNSWAKSLIIYHPEFPYYEWCLKNEKDNYSANNYAVPYQEKPLPEAAGPGAVYSSVSYDSLLVTINDLTLLVNSSDLVKVYDPLGITGGNVTDPYFDTNEPFAGNWIVSPNTAGSVAPSIVRQLNNGTPFMANVYYPKVYTSARDRFNNYLGSGLNLWEFTYAIIKGYATQYGQSISSNYSTWYSSSVFSSLTPSAPGNSVIGGSHYDYRILQSPYLTAQEEADAWEKYKFLYLSLKQELQSEAAQSYAANYYYYGNPGPSYSVYDVYNQCNDCIGNPSYAYCNVPFAPWDASSWVSNWFVLPYAAVFGGNHFAPCGVFLKDLYATKIKRFPGTNDALALGDGFNGDAAIYQTTGKCPAALDLETFIRDLATNNKITTNVSNLQTVPGFTKRLYDMLYAAANSGALPTSYPGLAWSQSVSGNVLSGTVGSLCSNISLTFPVNAQGINWSNLNTTPNFVSGVYGMDALGYSGGTSHFNIVFQVSNATDTYTYLVTGTTCGDIQNCNFQAQCEPDEFAIRAKNLFNAIAAEGLICSTSNITLSAPPINTQFSQFTGYIPSGVNWVYNHLTPTTGEIVDPTSSNPFKIVLSSTNFSNLCPGTNEVVIINTLRPDGSGILGHCSIAYTKVNTSTTAITTGTINGDFHYFDGTSNVGYYIGTCGVKSPYCSTPDHKVKIDLEDFLTNTANISIVRGDNSFENITNNLDFTFLLKQYVDGTGNYNTGSNTYTSPYYYLAKDATHTTSTKFMGSICSSTIAATSSAPTGTDNVSCCYIEYEFANTPGVGHSISSITSFSNFQVLSSPVTNGHQYSFSMTANFSGGGTELVYGRTSCFPIMACNDCDDEVVLEGNGASAGVVSPTITVVEDFESNTPGYDNGATSSTQVSCGPQSFTFINNATSIGAGEYTHSDVLSAVTSYEHKSGFMYTRDCYNWFIMYEKTLNLGSIYEKRCFNVLFNYVLVSPSSVFFDLYIGGNLVASVPATANTPNWNLFDFGVNIPYTYSSFPGGNVPLKIIVRANNGRNDNQFIYGIDNVAISMGSSCLPPICTETTTLTPFPPVTYTNPCYQAAIDDAISSGIFNYNNYIDSLKADFVNKYIKKCMGDVIENFYLDYASREYHYTLYYYDQAGNLVQTIPPQGVNMFTSSTDLQASRTARAGGTQHSPPHRMGTTYTYNSLNQLVKQYTPDGGESKFWYDKLGRLIASQNAKQYAASATGANVYSYTRYDYLGRISEVGQMTVAADLTAASYSALDGYLNPVSTPYPDNLSPAKDQVTRTYYGDDDTYYTTLASVPASHFGSITNSYSRGRVVASSIENTDDNDHTTYNHATYYSYDVHGNVKELLQHNPALAGFTNQAFKQTQYSYDLISGKVNGVSYQPGMPDQFYHRYLYDADNRLTRVYTSSNNVIWNQEAKYFYYLHGPLARVETSDDKVQGTDYAYTLHGWIKGVNSEGLTETLDIGKDGNYASGTTVNKHIGRDAYGYTLNYYSNTSNKDYIGIGSSSFEAAKPTGIITPLYNGNISAMTTTYRNYDPLALHAGTGAAVGVNVPYPILKTYQYDQLNRISSATAYKDYSSGTNAWSSSTNSKYNESFTYDANGNILTANRDGNAGSMDNLAYHYYNGSSGATFVPDASGATANPVDATNKLAYVSDNSALSGNYTDDIDNQPAGNYTYDAIGNLITDAAEGITNIDWTVYGKIKRITFSSKPEIEYNYDAAGNRISKVVKTGFASRWKYTYYVRDAQGNVMATYIRQPGPDDLPQFKLDEQHIYGSSRLGVYRNDIDLTDFTGAVNTTTVSRMLGLKSYELTNHLGNVIAVVSDKRTPVDVGSNGTIDYFYPGVLSHTDYYAFGAPMQGRKYQSSIRYKYGMNGKEKDDEIVGSGNSYDFGARRNDPRLGRWWSVDPEFKQYPHASPYSAFGNNPNYYIDPGGETLRVAGDARAREQARVALQKLTNDKVVIQSDGLVTLVSNNQNPSKKLTNGTQLIKDVVTHKRTTEILVGTFDNYQQNNNDEDARNGKGSDGFVVMGSPDVKVLVTDKVTKKSVMKAGGRSINLATELIHALKGMDGTQRKKNWIETNTYTDTNGNTKTETQQREELETHGLGGTANYKKDGTRYVNENDIRKEQGADQRAAYDTEYNTSSTGEKYKAEKK